MALVAVGTVVLALLLILLWFFAARHFRWQFRFGCRSLLLLASAVGVAYSLLVAEIWRERSEGEVAREIMKDGGSTLSRPTLLGRLLRDDSMVRVYTVLSSGPQNTDASLIRLRKLKFLRWLALDRTDIADVGLMNIEGLRELCDLRPRSAHGSLTGLARSQRAEESAQATAPGNSYH